MVAMLGLGGPEFLILGVLFVAACAIVVMSISSSRQRGDRDDRDER
jgi:hypothetical protein